MRILFLDQSTKLKTIHDLKSRARGGMVSSLFILSDALSRMNHRVEVASDIENDGTTEAGTWWFNYSRDIPSTSYDFLVCNRTAWNGFPEIRARHRILWTHDLPHHGHIPDPRVMRAFSATVFMSKYGERVWRCYYPTIGRGFTIPNGVDKSIFCRPVDKDFNYLIYASAPNRGLDRLPLIFEAIKHRTDRPVYMRAYSNLTVQHPNECKGGDLDGWGDVYQAVRDSSVELLDPIPQPELAQELAVAGIMVLPTEYPEICSNIILQALASGTPVATTGGNLGSACEWVRHRKNGMLTQFRPPDYMVYQTEMVRNACEVLNNEKLHKQLVLGAEKTKTWTWDEVSRAWSKMLQKFN